MDVKTLTHTVKETTTRRGFFGRAAGYAAMATGAVEAAAGRITAARFDGQAIQLGAEANLQETNSGRLKGMAKSRQDTADAIKSVPSKGGQLNNNNGVSATDMEAARLREEARVIISVADRRQGSAKIFRNAAEHAFATADNLEGESTKLGARIAALGGVLWFLNREKKAQQPKAVDGSGMFTEGVVARRERELMTRRKFNTRVLVAGAVGSATVGTTFSQGLAARYDGMGEAMEETIIPNLKTAGAEISEVIRKTEQADALHAAASETRVLGAEITSAISGGFVAKLLHNLWKESHRAK